MMFPPFKIAMGNQLEMRPHLILRSKSKAAVAQKRGLGKLEKQLIG